jgi:hypothetical protein
MILNKFLKTKKSVKEIRFVLERVKPCKSRMIFHKNNTIAKSISRYNGGRTP